MLNNFSYSKTFHLCLVFFLTLTIVGPLSLTQVDPHHDGIMLKPAVDVANGKMLFRDTFSQYGALTTLIQALAIKLFGKYLMVIRLLTALFYGLISILIWLIYSRILPKWLNTFSCVIWLFLGYFFINGPGSLIYPWSTVYAVFSVLLSLYFLILFFERQHFIFLLLTGISTSLVFWFKINYGIISFFSILLILLVVKKNFIKSLLIFLSGNFIIHGFFFIWLIINNSLEDFYLQTIKLTFIFSNNISNDFFLLKLIKSLSQIGAKQIGSIWSILPLITAGILIHSIYNFIKNNQKSLPYQIILAISFVSFGLWFGYYPVTAMFHSYLSSVLFIGMLTFFSCKIVEILSVEKNKIFIKKGIIFAAIIIWSFFLSQIYFKPWLITAIWSILPFITVGILIYSLFNILKRKEFLLYDRIILAIAFISVGLWFDYSSINALYQIYLSSVLFIGLFACFLWRIIEVIITTKVRAFLGTYKFFFAAAMVVLILSGDLFFRMEHILNKISTIKKYEKIETPQFLKGMYVPKVEKQIYDEIGKLVNKFPNYDLINLTNSGLYSLYKENNKEFHKMYVDWKWNNSYLYSDYIGKLNEQVSLNPYIIFSSDNLIIDGYIPIKLFPASYATVLVERLVFLIHGKAENVFKICNIDNSNERSSPSVIKNENENFFHIKLKSTKSIVINSIIAQTFTEHNIPKNIEKYEFEYNIIPRIFKKEDQRFIKELYSFDKSANQYSIPEMKDSNTIPILISIFSNIFLYEKYFYIADTFKNSTNKKIDIYLNNKIADNNEGDLLNLNTFKNDIIDLIIPVTMISPKYIIKLRINYNENYYEETIKNPK
jgi:hypothetical protein